MNMLPELNTENPCSLLVVVEMEMRADIEKEREREREIRSMLSDVLTRADLQVGSGLLYILISVEITPSVSSSSNIPARRFQCASSGCLYEAEIRRKSGDTRVSALWKLYTRIRYDESVKVPRKKEDTSSPPAVVKIKSS